VDAGDQLWSTEVDYSVVLVPIIRRSLAALAAVFLLQLMLLGSGTLCSMHGDTPRGAGLAHASHRMDHGMATPSATAGSQRGGVANADDAGTPTSPVECTGTGQHDGCHLPFAPGQCSSMTACDITATPAALVAASLTVHRAAPVPSSARRHAGPTFAPELPPPRV
jgi:hypothetical protein